MQVKTKNETMPKQTTWTTNVTKSRLKKLIINFESRKIHIDKQSNKQTNKKTIELYLIQSNFDNT